ncbi:MAG: glycosyltransferase [Chloroflexi bacterium]|nr:glycosyltransferase [Chloroflexota bacterium]
MRVLFLSRWYPYPADNGAKIRVFNLLRQLSRRHEVSLVTFAESTDRVDDETLTVLLSTCDDVQVVPYRPFFPSVGRALRGLLSSTPSYLVDTFSQEFASAVESRLSTRDIDLVICSELATMPYARRPGGAPALVDELMLSMFRPDGQRSHQLAELRSHLTWARLRRYVRCVLPGFAACTVTSRYDRRLVQATVPAYDQVHVVPNAVDLTIYDGVSNAPDPDTAVFAGALTYRANLDGIAWFSREVGPRLRLRVPRFRVRITGSTRGVDLVALAGAPEVEFTGYVADIRPVIARAGVSVVPIWQGGGTRLKILESMALGTPVVSTSKGAEGLAVSHGQDILLADDPEDFAACVEAVLRDAKLRTRLAENARRLVESQYDWNVVGPQFCEIAEGATRTARPQGMTVA